MWTQYFIYFTVTNNLFSLYKNIPSGKALVTHWMEKGEHFRRSIGKPDHELAEDVDFEFPPYEELQRYAWDAFPTSLVSRPTEKIPYSVVIGGIGIDIDSIQIKSLVSKLKGLGMAFRKYHVVIYENNSKSDSRQAWKDSLAELGEDATFISEDVDIKSW